MLTTTLIRYGEPSGMDHAPHGTLCKSVKTLCDSFEVYVQLSENEESPCWEKVGSFSPETEHTVQEEVERVLSNRKATVTV